MSDNVGHIRVLIVACNSESLHGLVRDLFLLDEHLETVVRHNAAMALALLEEQAFDVVVPDLKLPAGEAIMLMFALRQRYPNVLRMILADDPCESSFASAAHLAHLLLPRACNAGALYAAITDCLTAARRITDPAVGGAILRITTLPESRAIRSDLLRLFDDGAIDVGQLEQGLMQNPAIVAKILQVANSPYYGARFAVSSVVEAVSLLGLDTVRGIITTTRFFSGLSCAGTSSAFFDEIWQHSIATAVMVRRVARQLRVRVDLNRAAFTAGLLHDVGKIVLFLAHGERYAGLRHDRSSASRSLWQEEVRQFGLHHGTAGARLLEIWGLPVSIVEAVELHHTPHRSRDECPSPLTLVHLANALVHRTDAASDPQAPLDTSYLQRLLLPHAADAWSATIAESA